MEACGADTHREDGDWGWWRKFDFALIAFKMFEFATRVGIISVITNKG